MKALPLLFFLSPILMAICKGLEWDPFTDMPWIWITSPWWYLLLVVFTTAMGYITIESIKENKEKQVKTTQRKDFH